MNKRTREWQGNLLRWSGGVLADAGAQRPWPGFVVGSQDVAGENGPWTGLGMDKMSGALLGQGCS